MFQQRPLIRLGLLLLLVAVISAGCNGAPQSSAETGGAALTTERDGQGTVTVRIKDFAFHPEAITVAPGTRLLFVNDDPTPHNVVEGSAKEVTSKSHQPLFASGEIAPGERWELVLDEEGEYAFACTVGGHHLMGMTGTIRVAEGAAAPESAPVETAAEETRRDPAHPAPGRTGAPEGAKLLPEGLVELEPFRVEGNVKEFTIDIQEVTHELVDGVEVTAWAFNGVVPGPLLRVEEGDIVRVHFTNSHHQPHTIHWHGIYADQEHDGVPHTSGAVMPGETHVYEWVAEHPGTYLYHCHVDSYRHIDMGMYGGIVIEPKEGKAWEQEYTLILDDWDSEIEPLAPRYEPEPNHFLINGRAFPDLPTLPLKVGESTRVRLINAGYNNIAMHLHGPHFEVVATDGHDLPHPYLKDTLDIAPGERYDIVIRPTKAGMYPFHAHNIQYVRNDGFYPGGIHMMFEIVEDE